jgi:hypothetical protein
VIAGASWKVDYVRDSYSPLTDHLQKQDFDFATLRRADGLVRRGSSDAIPVIVAGHIQRTGQVINLNAEKLQLLETGPVRLWSR